MKPPAIRWSLARVGQAGVCFLLGLLFLYNPFFTVHDVPGNVQICHPPSYRATVASGELRRCTIESANPLIPEGGILTALAFAVVASAAAATPSFSKALLALDDVSWLAQQVTLEGLWFRPPPVLAS